MTSSISILDFFISFFPVKPAGGDGRVRKEPKEPKKVNPNQGSSNPVEKAFKSLRDLRKS